jgi:hypothetical protein
MQICEYYQSSCPFILDTVQGRWHFEMLVQEITEDSWEITFSWKDVFGKEEAM